jgi:gas vesicle protein
MSAAEIFLIGFVTGGLLFGLAGFLFARRSGVPADHRLEEELRQQAQQKERELAEARKTCATPKRPRTRRCWICARHSAP